LAPKAIPAKLAALGVIPADVTDIFEVMLGKEEEIGRTEPKF
jgi:hypothetical protein